MAMTRARARTEPAEPRSTVAPAPADRKSSAAEQAACSSRRLQCGREQSLHQRLDVGVTPDPRTVVGTEEALADGSIEKGEEPAPVVADVEQRDRLRVQAELRPREDLAQLV